MTAPIWKRSVFVNKIAYFSLDFHFEITSFFTLITATPLGDVRSSQSLFFERTSAISSAFWMTEFFSSVLSFLTCIPPTVSIALSPILSEYSTSCLFVAAWIFHSHPLTFSPYLQRTPFDICLRLLTDTFYVFNKLHSLFPLHLIIGKWCILRQLLFSAL